jgi:hypothetical protein
VLKFEGFIFLFYRTFRWMGFLSSSVFHTHAGTPELGGRRGSRPHCPLPGGARGAKVPFPFKGLLWRNSELSEMLVRFFYEFASENARNEVIELQE